MCQGVDDRLHGVDTLDEGVSHQDVHRREARLQRLHDIGTGLEERPEMTAIRLGSHGGGRRWRSSQRPSARSRASVSSLHHQELALPGQADAVYVEVGLPEVGVEADALVVDLNERPFDRSRLIATPAISKEAALDSRVLVDEPKEPVAGRGGGEGLDLTLDLIPRSRVRAACRRYSKRVGRPWERSGRPQPRLTRTAQARSAGGR